MPDTPMPTTGGMVPPPNATTQARLPDGSINPLYQLAAAGVPVSQPGNTSPFTPFLAPAMPASAQPTYQHSGIGEIAAGFARGMVSGAPEALGQSMEYAGRLTGSQGLQDAGQNVTQFGQRVPDSWSWLRPSVQGTHGAVVNTLANAAEGIGSFAPSIALGMVNPAAGIAAGAAQMAGQSGEQTYEQAKAKGVAPADAMKASLLNAGIGLATGVAGGAIGGKLIGAVADPIANLVGRGGAALAEDTVNQLAGTGGILGPTLRQLPTAMGEAGVVNAAQAAGTAEVNKQYGIDDTSPLAAAGQGFVQGLALGAVGTPAALAGRALMARTARQQTAILESPDTSEAQRTAYANAYAQQIAKADSSAAANFRANAQTAIEYRMPLDVTPDLLTAGKVQTPPMPELAGPPTEQPNPQLPQTPTVPAAAAPGEQGGLFSEAMAPTPQGPQRPAGAATEEAPQAQPPVQSGPDLFSPENMSATALANARAAMQNPTEGTQAVIDHATGAAQAPVMTRDQFAARPENADLKGQELAKAFKAYQADPVAYERAQRQQALEDHFAQPSGQRVQDENGIERELTNGELFDLHNQQPVTPGPTDLMGDPLHDQWTPEQPATPAAAPDTATPDLFAPLSRDDALDAARGALKDAGLGGLGQVGKRLDDAGVLDAKSRSDQLDLLRTAVANAREGTKTRDGLQALLDRWHAERPDLAPAQDDESAGNEPTASAGNEPAATAQRTTSPATDTSFSVRNGQTAKQQAQFAKAVGATGQAQGTLRGRQNAAAGKAVQAGDFDGMIAALKNSKAAVVQHIATVASRLGLKVGINNDALETRAEARLGDNDRAKALVSELDAGRAAVAALGDAPDTASSADPRVKAALDTKLAQTGYADADFRDAFEGSTVKQSVGKLAPNAGEIREWAANNEKIAAHHGEAPLREAAGQQPVERTKVGGMYDPATRTLTTAEHTARDEQTLTHELAHAVTHEALDRPTPAQRPFADGIKALYEHVKAVFESRPKASWDTRTPYGLHDVHEFVSEGLGNPDFQHMLHTIPYASKSVWGKLAEHVAGLLGIKREQNTAFTELLAQHEALTGARGAAPTLPDAVPVNDFTQQPEAAAQAQAAMPQNTTPDPAQTALDRMNTLKRGLVTMQEDNAGLSPTSQRWFDAADRHVDALYGHVSGEAPLDTAKLGDTVKQANALYNRAQQLIPDEYLERRGGAEHSNPAILDAAAQSGKLSDALGHIAANGSTDEAKALAKRLQPLTSDTTIGRTPLAPEIQPDGRADQPQGRYTPASNHIDIHPGEESEATVLHEAAHAALYNTTERLLNLQRPGNQAEAQQLKALRDMDDVRQRALAVGGTEYGLSNIHDFQAELLANPKFQDFLRDQGTQKSLWERSLDAVRRMLGMKVDDRNALEKAMTAGNTLLDGAARERDFNASPQGALRTTDTVLNRMARDVDRIKPDQMRRVSLGVFKSLLGAQTQDFTLHMAQGVPEFRQFGFDKALKANLDARDATDRASRELGEPLGKYMDTLRKLLPDTDKGNKLGQDMMRVAGEAAIRGVDFTKNAADNIKAGNTIEPGMEATINDIHRQYTQLPQEARDALNEGARHNLRLFTQTMATVVRSRMEALTGQVGRMQAELDRIAPGDAARARAQERLNAATAEADFVANHIPGLDVVAAKGDGAAGVLGSRLKAVFDGARKSLAQGSPLRTALGELEGMYTAQSRNPYYSLGRDGDYFVNVAFKGDIKPETQAKLQQAALLSNKVIGDLKGQTHAFMRVRSIDEAEGLFNRLRQAGGDALDMPNSSHGLLADTSMRSVYGVSDALRQIESDLHDSIKAGGLSDEDAAHAQQVVTRSLLSLLPETAARSAKMQRRGVPGYDADFQANFARRAQGGVQDVSQLYAARARSAALKSMQDTANEMKRSGSLENATKAQMITDEMQRRFANSTQRMDNSAVNMINAFGHSFYLAASPAFLIRTMAQPYHRGVPEVGARYGFVAAAREMGRATGTAVKVIQRSMVAAAKDAKAAGESGARAALNTGIRFDDLGLNASDTQFLRDIHSMGVLELGQTQQLQHAAQGLSLRKQDALRFLSSAAQYAEMTNRMVVGMAAFRLAMKDSRIADPEARRIAATEYAVKSINNAMDNFKTENTARYIGKNGVLGKVTPLATAFMNYQLQTMQQIIRGVHDGFFGQDKSAEGLQRAKEARGMMYGLLATTSIIAGSMGLPFATAIAGVYNTLHNLMDPDDPRDVRDDYRNFLNETFGREGGDLIADGPISSALHMDTSTYGLQSILPGSDFLAARGQLKDRLADQSQALLGPAINAGLDITQGIGKIIDGNYVKGIEAMIPAGLKPAYKAAELAGVVGPGGYTDSQGNQTGQPMGSWDVALQALGFRTQDKATHDEAKYNYSADQEALQARRQVLGERMYRAAMQGGDMGDALSGIQQFNTANPTQPMRDIGGDLRDRMMAQQMGIATGLYTPLTRRQIMPAENDVGYAAMPAAR